MTQTVAQMRDQIAAQETEIAALRETIEKLAQGMAELRQPMPSSVAAPQRKVEPDGVRIYHPQDRPAIEMPSDDELRRLAKIVLRKFPSLAPDTTNPRWCDENVSEWNAIFRASFRRIASLNRDKDDRFDMKRSIHAHTAECEEWLSCHGMAMVVKWPPFVAAAIASGDVAFCIDGGPYVALRLDGLGRSPLPAWRAVLDGRMRKPSPPPGR